jgi:hypothetical protein
MGQIVVVLDVAIRSESAKAAFRAGMATDCINWLGRLTRSEVAAAQFAVDENTRDLWPVDCRV